MARLRLVPLRMEWYTLRGPSGAFLFDIKAIYRRPQKDRYGTLARDEAGFPIWDLTAGLPIHDHPKWAARSFQYVTLSDLKSLESVGDEQKRDQGAPVLDAWRDYQQNRLDRGPWDGALYLLDLADERVQEIADLNQLILDMGPAHAERFMQQRYPEYVIPPGYALNTVSPPPLADDEHVAPLAPKAKPKPRGRPRKVAQAVT